MNRAEQILDLMKRARALPWPNATARALQGELAKIHSELEAEFGAARGWKPARGWFSAEQLRCNSGGQIYTMYGDMFPHFDHPTFYRAPRTRRAGGLVIQPYIENTPETRAEIIEEYRVLGLSASFPDYPSWWYPGATTLILIERPANILN